MPLTIFFFTAAAARMRSSHRTGDAKRTVRIHRLVVILQFSRSPFLQLNCCFQGQLTIGDISSHRPIFAPPLLPPARVYYKGAATQKKLVRKDSVLMIFQFFHSLFFQLNCSFRGQHATRDIVAHRPIFAPPPPSSARLYLHRAATQKEW